MGRMLIEAALAADDVSIVAALERADSPQIGRALVSLLLLVFLSQRAALARASITAEGYRFWRF